MDYAAIVELPDETARRLLECFGLHIVDYRTVSTVDDAMAAAAELGYPVVLKATGERFWRRSDLIGVRLDLSGDAEVRAAYAEVSGVSGSTEVYVQRMARKGTGCAIGVRDDPSFGTLVSFGLSGVVSELLGDLAYRALPLTDVDAASLVRAPRAAPVLTGYGGGDPVDLDVLADLVSRVGVLAEEIPEVRWLAVEPVLATPAGAQIIGARVKVGRSPSAPDAGPRQLRSLTSEDATDPPRK